MHCRQAPTGSSNGWSQNRGIWMPASSAARITSVPLGTWTATLSMVTVIRSAGGGPGSAPRPATGIPAGAASVPASPPADLITVTIDNVAVQVPKGTLVIRAAELAGIQIPRFCDHPLLDPVGACRQCIVEVEGQRKPLTSCTTTCTDGMVVRTQVTSAVAEKAQRGIIELLLINHPLDCPVCDKGGECPLQNQAMSTGSAVSRFHDVKRTFPKPIAICWENRVQRAQCVLCARCTRFSQ